MIQAFFHKKFYELMFVNILGGKQVLIIFLN